MTNSQLYLLIFKVVNFGSYFDIDLNLFNFVVVYTVLTMIFSGEVRECAKKKKIYGMFPQTEGHVGPGSYFTESSRYAVAS